MAGHSRPAHRDIESESVRFEIHYKAPGRRALKAKALTLDRATNAKKMASLKSDHRFIHDLEMMIRFKGRSFQAFVRL